MTVVKVTPKSLSTVILPAIRKSLLELGSATKVELSEHLQISFPTISKFLTRMEKNGEVISVGLDKSSGGRRAKRYRYNPDYMLGLAIFLERTETIYTIFNCAGEIKKQGKASSVLIDNGIYILTKFIEKVIKANSSKISSIAIGVPGSVENGRIFYIPGYEQFQNLDLKGYIEDSFSIPVVVENDMNAAVLGFSYNNRIEENQSLVYLYSGQNGPGAGLMINGDVVRGSTFFAGEISFVPQYDERNFSQALKDGSNSSQFTNFESNQIDAISRLVATFTAIMNPHTIIFCRDEVEKEGIDKIAIDSAKYIPSEHLPELTISDWKQDYLYGLQKLCLDLMMNK
nr:ROK family transcriptional regulator [Caldifermentibacillus hisashii]